MHTVTITFAVKKAYVTASVPCRTCDRVSKREIKGEATVNPMNRIDGEVATPSQVQQQALEAAKAEAERVIARGYTCSACYKASAPPHTKDFITNEEMRALNTAAINMVSDIERLLTSVREQSKAALVGRDVVIDGREAQVTEVNVWQDGLVLGYRFYSRSRHAAEGDLLADTHWQRISRFSDGN